MMCDFTQDVKRHKLKDKLKDVPKVEMKCEADCHDCDYHWSKKDHKYEWNNDEEKHYE